MVSYSTAQASLCARLQEGMSDLLPAEARRREPMFALEFDAVL